MTFRHLVGLLSIAALAACGGTDTAASGAAQPLASDGTQTKRVSYEGNTLQFDEVGGKLTNLKAFSADGKQLEVVEYSAKDLVLCLPRSGAAAGEKMSCQPFASATSGAFIRMGTATCTCRVFGGYLYCYGSTCP